MVPALGPSSKVSATYFSPAGSRAVPVTVKVSAPLSTAHQGTAASAKTTRAQKNRCFPIGFHSSVFSPG